MDFSLFIDFDGTTSTVDVGNRFFTTFSGGRNIPLVEKWLRREISSFECLREEAKLITASEAQLASFSKQFSIVLEAINITDEPYMVYEGVPDRPRQDEYYGWWATLGVRFDL